MSDMDKEAWLVRKAQRLLDKNRARYGETVFTRAADRLFARIWGLRHRHLTRANDG